MQKVCLTGNEESGIIPKTKKYYTKTPMIFRRVKVEKTQVEIII
jgi:hypothetical protein